MAFKIVSILLQKNVEAVLNYSHAIYDFPLMVGTLRCVIH